MAFITKTVAEALKAVPVVNASVDDTDILYRKDINIGVAVALDWGLIVPVIKNADRRNLLDISKAIVDLAGRARDKKLLPDEVQGGTFTITNPGVFGALFGMPIIDQPQVAILGVGAVEKRPVTPGAIVPAREQLGDMLLESNRASEALNEFEKALTMAPQRRRALMGQARAREILAAEKS